MLEFICLFFPAIVATAFYMQLRGGKIPVAKSISYYATFTLTINAFLHIVAIYLLNNPFVMFTDVAFIKYTVGALAVGLIFALLASFMPNNITIKIVENGEKIIH